MPAEVRRAKRAEKVKPTRAEPEDDEDAIHADEDEAGISESGLQKLMRLLGEDGLNEADLAALHELKGQAAEDEEEEDEGDEDEDDDEEEDEEEDEEKDEKEEDEKDDEEEDDEEEEEENDQEKDDVEQDPVALGAKDRKASAVSAPKDSLAASILRSGLVPQADDEEDEEEDEEEDAEEDEEEDEDEEELTVDDLPESMELPEATRASKHNRIRINNVDALERIYDEFRLGGPSPSKGTLPWIETMSVTYGKKLADEVPNPQNDLERELAFYRQALDGAMRGRELVLAANVPFSRPGDYFAEMVKTDEHMERIRQRLLDESASIKASENAKRQRELKKYGKQIQTEKLLERQKNKRDLEDKVNSLKRKRGGLELDDDEFDVQLEEALDDQKQARTNRAGNRPKMSRQKRNDKYGFGGKKRYNKSNDLESLDHPGGARGKKGGRPARKAQRPGKSRRAAGRR